MRDEEQHSRQLGTSFYPFTHLLCKWCFPIVDLCLRIRIHVVDSFIYMLRRSDEHGNGRVISTLWVGRPSAAAASQRFRSYLLCLYFCFITYLRNARTLYLLLSFIAFSFHKMLPKHNELPYLKKCRMPASSDNN